MRAPRVPAAGRLEANRPPAEISIATMITALTLSIVLWVWIAAFVWFLMALATSARAQVAQAMPIVGEAAVYLPADSRTIAAANTAITVFNANEIQAGCIIVNTLTVTLYIDFTTTAVAGSGTAIPIAVNASFTCPYPPRGAVSAVASATGGFVAVRF